MFVYAEYATTLSTEKVSPNVCICKIFYHSLHMVEYLAESVSGEYYTTVYIW